MAPSSAKVDVATACPAIPELPALACVATEQGLFYAASPQAATQAADDGAEAIAAFHRYFGQEVPFGAVVLTDSFPKEKQDAFIAENSLGYLRLWVPPESKAAMIEQSIRKAMPNLPEEQVRALALRAGQSTGDVLRHELGHSLYSAVFWPQHASDDTRYATPAPDWLDEASAILMEPETMLADRRSGFRQLLREKPTSIRPLSEFLVATHPLGTASQRAQLALQGSTQTGTGVTVAVKSGDTASELSTFYLQSLAIADFLIERSGQQDLLGNISKALASGTSFDSWLMDNGEKHHLGTNVYELDKQWIAWLSSIK